MKAAAALPFAKLKCKLHSLVVHCTPLSPLRSVHRSRQVDTNFLLRSFNASRSCGRAAVLHMSDAVLSHDRVRMESARFELRQDGLGCGPVYVPDVRPDPSKCVSGGLRQCMPLVYNIASGEVQRGTCARYGVLGRTGDSQSTHYACVRLDVPSALQRLSTPFPRWSRLWVRAKTSFQTLTSSRH